MSERADSMSERADSMSAVSAPPVRERLDPRVWKILSIVLIGPLMSNLDSTVVNVSLTALGRELHVGLATLQWVVTGYLLALALMLPLSGWLVDRVGAKRVYLACFALFTVASLLCGVSNSAASLIAARILQGMAGGLLAPLAQMMVAREAPRHIAQVMGILVVPVLLGPIFGPSLAGVILQHASWRWLFFINLPIGIFGILLAALILPADVPSARLRTFDLTGFLLLSPGLVLLLYSLENLSANPASAHIALLELVFAVTLLAGFVLHATQRAREALIDLRLFRDPAFSASASTVFLTNALSFGGQMLLPLYLLSILNRSPSDTGLLLAPAGVGMLCSYPLMGMLTDRFGSRRVSTTGAVIALLGTLPFALLPPSSLQTGVIAVTLFVRGLGMGSISIPSIAAAYSSIAKEEIPVATTAINIVQRFGGPAATTVLAIFLHARTASLGVSSGSAAFAATFWLLCAFHAASVLAALRLPLWAKPPLPNSGYEPD